MGGKWASEAMMSSFLHLGARSGVSAFSHPYKWFPAHRPANVCEVSTTV